MQDVTLHSFDVRIVRNLGANHAAIPPHVILVSLAHRTSWGFPQAGSQSHFDSFYVVGKHVRYVHVRLETTRHSAADLRPARDLMQQ